ncbi:hypothetical protein GCM10010306_068440 [Streptomyces umbrinus]|uniref:twin-arginine translocase TatA/TatE family subunit n=1 Tax=Streptomyces umbrinus TaxID=67370 RepID=UPI001678794B|nr:twin-arginine translocase TatA/TatE family subunit [Streptomyces umbrinus]GHB65044.1 hypothetical protein GCM10010306_068440 [Streptomyces umbrinus]
MFGLSEVAIILVVVILVLAAKKLPDLARSAGKSARILKAEAEAAAAKDEPAGTDGQTGPRVIPGETVGPKSTTPADSAQPSAAPHPARPDSGQPRPQD